jgi:hypothetical protein
MSKSKKPDRPKDQELIRRRLREALEPLTDRQVLLAMFQRAGIQVEDPNAEDLVVMHGSGLTRFEFFKTGALEGIGLYCEE